MNFTEEPKIEIGFKQAVHVLGAHAYHFWMADMKPIRRGSGNQYLHRTSDGYRAETRRKLNAYHVHVQLGVIAQGLLQHLAINHTAAVWHGFRSWLRTMNGPCLHPNWSSPTPCAADCRHFSRLPLNSLASRK